MRDIIESYVPRIESLTESGRRAEELSSLVHQIYEAVVHPAHWPTVVGAIAQSMGASKGLLFTPYMRPQDGGFIFPWMIEESHLQLWGSKYIDHDVWAQNIIRKNLWQVGHVLVDEELVSREEFEQSVFYREFLSTMSIGRVCTGLIFGGSAGLPETNMSLFKPFHSSPFSEQDIAWYRLLIPHLSRALGLQQHLDSLRVQNQSMLAAFDRLDCGACLLDQTGRVAYANPAANRVFARADGLVLDSAHYLSTLSPTARASRSTPSLKDWINAQIPTSHQSPNYTEHFTNAFLVSRTQPSQRYAVQSTLLPASLEMRGQSHARMAIFITDPDAMQLPPAQRLMDLYGLTKRQASVARALGGGSSYKEIAQEFKVSEHTVASHVKEVYAKVKVNRHADLIRHIMALGKATV